MRHLLIIFLLLGFSVGISWAAMSYTESLCGEMLEICAEYEKGISAGDAAAMTRAAEKAAEKWEKNGAVAPFFLHKVDVQAISGCIAGLKSGEPETALCDLRILLHNIMLFNMPSWQSIF